MEETVDQYIVALLYPGQIAQPYLFGVSHFFVSVQTIPIV